MPGLWFACGGWDWSPPEARRCTKAFQTTRAEGLQIAVDTADPLISVGSAPVDYGDVLGGASGVPGKSCCVFTVDPSHAIGGSASFTITVSDSAGLSWTDTFLVPISGLSAVAGQVRDATGAGIAQAAVRYAAAMADYDNDGDLDILVPRFGQPGMLYRNNGDGTYTDVAIAAGVSTPCNATAAIFLDMDNDGDKDLFVATWNQANRLYENQGDGTFRDVSVDSAIADPPDYYTGVAAANVDGDGDLDLFLPVYGESDRLLLNDGKGVFRDASAAIDHH